MGFGRTVRLLPSDLGDEGSLGNRGSAIHWVCPLEIMSKLVFILYTVDTSQVC